MNNRLVGRQQCILVPPARTIRFHFDFPIASEYVADIWHVDEMTAENVPESDLFPVNMYLDEANNDIYAIFPQSRYERVYAMDIWELDEESKEFAREYFEERQHSHED